MEVIDGNRQFHTKLIEEFEKTGQQIVPMTSKDFFQMFLRLMILKKMMQLKLLFE